MIQAWKYFAPKSWEFHLHVYNTQVISSWSTMERFRAVGTNSFKTAFCGVKIKLMLRPELITQLWTCEASADHVAWVLEVVWWSRRWFLTFYSFRCWKIWPFSFHHHGAHKHQALKAYRVFSLMWSMSMFFNRKKRKRLHKNRVQFPEDNWIFGDPNMATV